MKFCDILKLIKNEYKYERAEWILSFLLQVFIFTSVLFLFTVVADIDKICGDYLSPLFPDGYSFWLKGYSEDDLPELEKMGFYDVRVDESGEGYGLIKDLDGIWLHKFEAAISGKDIWEEELEQILSVILFCQVTFAAIGIAMTAIMLNNLLNSYAMKLIQRKRYIEMLDRLGCPKTVCQSIYYWFFGIRNITALLLAVGVNAIFIHMLNRYIERRMYIASGFSEINVILTAVMLVISMSLMWISFKRQWSRTDE